MITVPTEFPTVPLSERAEIIMGQSPPGATYNETGHGTPFLQGKAEFGDVVPTHSRWTTQPLRIAPRGSTLISVRAPVGDANIADRDYCVGRGLAAVVAGPNLDANFLFYWIRHSKDALEAEGTGSTFKAIRKSILAELAVPDAPIAEQRAISHALSTVQRAMRANEQVIKAARELKKSLMHKLFSGPSGSAQSIETEFGTIPAHWTMTPLSDCAEIQTGLAKGRQITSGELLEVPYLRVANVQDGFLDLDEIKTIAIRPSELSRFSLRVGDILLTEGGDFDKLGRGHIWRGEIDPCVHQNHIFAVRPDPDVLTAIFASYLIQSPYAKAYFLKVAHRTTNLASINKTKLGAFPMPIPPLDEQREIERQLGAADLKIGAEVARGDALGVLFESLLHDLTSARLRVADLIPEVA